MTAPLDATVLAERYREVVARVHQAPRQISSPSALAPVLIAVSKKQPWQAVEALYALGHRDFGENYAQELAEKATVLEERGCVGIRWHFIGHLQTNKVKLITPWVHAVHSVDSLKLAQELAKRAERPLQCFLEVNVDGEGSKAGIAPADAPSLARDVAALPGLELQGLMAIPAPVEETASAVSASAPANPFARLRELELTCRPFTQGGLSMGMSSDFEAALREGATHVRVGTSIFGARS